MQTILVIEDDRAIRGAIEDILELDGFRVVSAEDGRAGVELARAELPTLIVCDIMMPYLDGYGVLQLLRKHRETATIPFIFLTARTTQDDVRQGMNLGADDYLTKPFRAEVLLSTIQARIERQARLAERLQHRVTEMQSNLMSVLPHELNTPLHGILAGVEFLRDEYATLEPSDVEELLCIVHQSALRMRRLVANSLLHAELRAGIHTNRASVSGAKLHQDLDAHEVVTAIQLAAERESADAARMDDLRLEIVGAPLHILPTHLSKIVEELVNNACKYSKSGTPIKVTAFANGDCYRLAVIDHGRGMIATEIAAIGEFQQFQRKQFEQQGLGLGLALTRGLLECYQGRVEIQSVPGEGTVVTVQLPLIESVGTPC